MKNDENRSIELTTTCPTEVGVQLDSFKLKPKKYHIVYAFPNDERPKYDRKDVVYRICVGDNELADNLTYFRSIYENVKIAMHDELTSYYEELFSSCKPYFGG